MIYDMRIYPRQSFVLSSGDKSLSLGKKTIVMGVLNVTPDSFSDGGLYSDKQQAINRAAEMIQEGAGIIDIGGESTRPGSASVSEKEELQRVLPVIKGIREKLPDVFLSIDTYRSGVAKEALEVGADMVNSLGGFLFDPKLAEIVSDYAVPIVIYHIKGQPKTMQKGKILYKDVIGDIKKFFEEQIAYGILHGVKREQFLIDPGIGFGKTVVQNVEIIKRLSEFQPLGLPIVIGVSRKSHLGFILKDELKLSDSPPPLERVEASLAETAVVVFNGARIVRTHDVLQTRKFLAVLDKFITAPSSWGQTK